MSQNDPKGSNVEKISHVKTIFLSLSLLCLLCLLYPLLYYKGMEQNRPLLVTTEEVKKLPLLVVDKKGTVGVALAKKLQEEFLVVLVSAHPAAEELIHKNIIHIPYRKRIPMIPDNVYSHMFLFYNGEKEVLDMLPAFVRKSRQTNSKLFFITSLPYANQRLFSYLSHHAFHDVQIMLFGEVFGERIAEANVVNHYIHQARVYGRIEIVNSGLEKIYPVAMDDVLNAVIATAFGLGKKRKLLYVFPHHPITEVSVGRILQKIDPHLKVDFIKQKRKTIDYFIPEEGEYFYQNYDLEERLRPIDLSRKVSQHVVPQNKLKLILPNRKVAHPLRAIIFSLLFVVLLPIIITFLSALIGASALSSAAAKAEEFQLGSAHRYASFAQQSFHLANMFSPGLTILGMPFRSQSEEFMQKIKTGEEVSILAVDMLGAGEKIANVYDGKSKNPKDDFFHATATLKNALLTLQQMKAEDRLPKSVVVKLDGLRDTVGLVENTIDLWPTLSGFEGKKTYLVLFQNNMELRPGGGFIGSYALLTLENGKAEKMKIFDIYDADGQLKEHVEPPYGLRRYLGASHWFMRDSNYDIDFTRDAVEAARFLKSEMGETVDGVIAVDTTFLQNILGALGEVDVPDYEEKVRADNFYMVTQSHAEKDFFPGSTQKKDFLRALTNAMLLQLEERKNPPYREILDQVVKSIRQKHVMIVALDPAVQNLFTVNNMSSSLWDGRSGGENAFLDYLGVVEANVGTNKVNYYIKRALQHLGSIDEQGDYQATAIISYDNTSKKDSPFGGDYKNYVRFVLPANAELKSVLIDDTELTTLPAITDPAIYTKKDFVPPSGLEIEKTIEKEKTIIGFFLIVPAGSSKKISLTYTVSRAVNTLKSAFSYDLVFFKQPGTGDDPYSFALSYPATFKMVASDKSGRDVGGKVVESGTLSGDTNIRMEFSKK